ncbi:hypothetical protein [Corynebacterium parakroppenstedtii]|uniref:hypothetical protein n=1 Tax=Corynebacterium parakroppenstedtii TaxID=2828363 RepID=UPI001C8E5F6F|nr:hypothetical protein [Corynebacterium parakroppenstedtii]
MAQKDKDFDQISDLFAQKNEELRNGAATLVNSPREASITDDRFYLLKGAPVCIAEVYDPEPDAPLDFKGKPDTRLRVIYENGTENTAYAKSFAIRLYAEHGRH